MRTSQERVTLDAVIDAFVKGWVYCRQVPETTLELRSDGVYHVHFGHPVGGRTDEILTRAGMIQEVIPKIREDHSLFRTEHWITVFQSEPHGDEHGQSLASTMAEDGYVLAHSEYLMHAHLPQMPSGIRPDMDVRRILHKKDADEMELYFQRSVVMTNRLADPHLRYYGIYQNDNPVGHGTCSVLEGVACLDNIFVSSEYRGQGLAAAMCKRMLEDAALDGAVGTVLVSSEMGHTLYRKLGYLDVAQVFVFKPHRATV